MYNGQTSVPLVVRTPMGGGRGYGPTHSQSLEKLFLGVPHLRIVAPALYHRPGEVLRHAVLGDDGVVLFLEHKLLYPARLATDDAPPIFVETRGSGYPVVFVRNFERGRPDVTIIGYGGASLLVHPLLAKLAEEEIRLLVVMPACIQPLPADDLLDAARQAGRVVIVEEGTRAFGWGAEVAALLAGMPLRRVAALDTVIPAAKALEALVLPSSQTVEEAIYEVLA
jgi:pyruvate/2-oxoglutarate/acetoin dehydrogenase E1 component